jgi:hypothetical protein
VLLLRLRRPPAPIAETLTPEEEARLAQLRDS